MLFQRISNIVVSHKSIIQHNKYIALLHKQGGQKMCNCEQLKFNFGFDEYIRTGKKCRNMTVIIIKVTVRMHYVSLSFS